MIKVVQGKDDEWEDELNMNRALIALTKKGRGPVHINLETTYNRDFSVQELSPARIIRLITYEDEFPTLPTGKIGIFIGAHLPFKKRDEQLIDKFCSEHDALVFCDKTSNYQGKYRVSSALVASQKNIVSAWQVDLLIHLGDISGDYPTMSLLGNVKEVWRISNDGKIIDTFRHLSYTFEMTESFFFQHYVHDNQPHNEKSFNAFQKEYDCTVRLIPEEFPFSNIWMAKTLAPKLPQGSSLHLGILNSLRSWNFFETPDSVTVFSNVGGFGIDGGLSSLLGASLADPSKLFFGIFGDLAFFYDINSLANRHRGKNLRILLVNNGKGTEFRNYNHAAARFGEDTDAFIAAAGHYGNKSKNLIRHFAEDLGYRYLSADNKDSFLKQLPQFISDESDQSIIFETFTDSEKESSALQIIEHLLKNDTPADNTIGKQMKELVKKSIGEKGVKIVKLIAGKDKE